MLHEADKANIEFAAFDKLSGQEARFERTWSAQVIEPFEPCVGRPGYEQ
jgi:hypothetical protein